METKRIYRKQGKHARVYTVSSRPRQVIGECLCGRSAYDMRWEFIVLMPVIRRG